MKSSKKDPNVDEAMRAEQLLSVLKIETVLQDGKLMLLVTLHSPGLIFIGRKKEVE